MALRNTHIAHLIEALGRGVSVVEDTEGLVLKIDLPLLTASGTNTYTITSGFTDALTSYTDTAFLVKFTNACTGASTLNIDGVGATALKKSGTTALASGDIAAGQIFLVVHDGTNWQMIGIGGSGGGSGDVVGPGSAVDSNIVLFDTTTGKLIKDSGKAHSTDGTLASNSDAKIPTEKAVKTYVDGVVVGLWDDRGNFDASVNAYPSSGGSGTAGAILKGDIWTISVAGTLPTSQVVEVGDVVRALVDTPGNTQANWSIQQNNIGYTAENSANKTDVMTGNEASSTKYLSSKGTYDWATGAFSAKQGTALSVWGVAGNATADNASITAGADYNILRRSGVTLGFGSIDLSQAGAVGASVLGAANGGTGAANLNGFWLAGSGVTMTASNTITSNTAGWFNVTGTWTAPANNSTHGTFGGTFTARGTAADTLNGYLYSPTLVAAANNQLLQSVLINPTFTNGAFTGLTNTYLHAGSSTHFVRLVTNSTGTTVGIGLKPSGGNLQTILTDTAGNFIIFPNSINLASGLYLTNSTSADSNAPRIQRGGTSGQGQLILNAGTTSANQIRVNITSVDNAASGTSSLFGTDYSFVKSANTLNYILSDLSPTINTTGTYAGTFIGYNYNPTLTSVTGLTNLAFRATSGSVLIGHTTLGATTTRLQVRGIGTGSGILALFEDSAGTARWTLLDNGGASLNGDLTMSDAKNLIFNTTTGTKIGTATSQKIGFWNATPIVQPTTAIAASTFVANTSGIVNDTATWDGYTMGQVVKALRNTGLLA